MGVETFAGKYITDLNTSWPDGDNDAKSGGDDHIRGIKTVLKNTFPNVSGAVTANHTELSYCDIDTVGTVKASRAVTVDSNKMTKGLLLDEATCVFADASATTKQLRVEVSSATAGTTLTLASAHTANRTVTLPNATGTLATTADITAQALLSSRQSFAAESVGTGSSITQAVTGTVQNVMIAFHDVSLSALGRIHANIGTSSSLTSSGYTGSVSNHLTYFPAGTDGMYLAALSMDTSLALSGRITWDHVGSNKWVGTAIVYNTDGYCESACAQVTLGGALDIVGIVAGAGVFDSGAWHVFYERTV